MKIEQGMKLTRNRDKSKWSVLDVYEIDKTQYAKLKPENPCLPTLFRVDTGSVRTNFNPF